MKFKSLAWAIGCWVAAGAATAADAPPPISFEALLGFDRLPLLTDWPAYQNSSCHLDDINQDAGNFIRVEANGDQVLTDTDGPGVIYRLWSTGVVGMQMSSECRLRFYFDWESEPRLDLSMSELFGDKGSRWPFVPPLSVTFESGVGGGEGPCNLSYVPIPFAKHLKIVGRNVMFYHVNYHRLPEGTPVESFSLQLAQKHRDAIEKAAALWNEIPERPGARRFDKVEELKDFVLQPGAERKIEIRGEGCVGTLSLKLAEPSPRNLRGVVLEAAFEGKENVCVRAPAGDFFGSGCGDRRFKSLPAGMTDEGYYAHWPMPLRKEALLVLRNETQAPVKVERWMAGWFLGPQPPGAGYFHARYVENHDIPKDEDYRILDVAGRGKLVGANVTMQNARGAQGIFFLEGDEKIYADGERYPSRWLGTGTEDYFNGSYFWNAPGKAAMARPLGGLTFLDWGIGRVCAYRWHFPDFVSFKKSLRVDLEHGGESEWPSHYMSVAYYYLEKPSAQPPLPALSARLPRTPLPPAPGNLCCEVLKVEGKGKGGEKCKVERRAISELDPEYETKDSVSWWQGRPGQEVEALFDVPGEDEFKVVLFLSGGPDHGALHASLDSKPLGEVNARRPSFTPWFPVEYGPVRLGAGQHCLGLKLAAPPLEPAAPASQCAAAGTTGQGQGSADLAAALVAIQLKPGSRFIDQWSIVGNWPCPREGGWEVANEPEKSQDLSTSYRLPSGGEARWREHKGDYVGLSGGDWVVAYGLTYIFSPDERPVGFFIAKDDGLKLWLGGEVIFDQYTWSHGTPDHFHAKGRLKKGWNKLLVKCANWGGAWAFAIRPGDPDKMLEFARSPK